MNDLKRWTESSAPAIGAVPAAGWPWMLEILPLLARTSPLPKAEADWGIDESGRLFEGRAAERPAAAVFPCELSQVPALTLWRLRRRGCAHFFFPARARWIRQDSLSAFRARFFRDAARIAARAFPGPLPRTILENAEAENRFVNWGRKAIEEKDPGPLSWPEFIAYDNAQMKQEGPRALGPHRVALYIGSLGPGGAERQFCNLANRLCERGHGVTPIFTYHLHGPSGHYAELLKHPQLAPVVAADEPDDHAMLDTDLLLATPPDLHDAVIRLASVLRRTRPQILYAWLDQCNLIGAMAGLLAGVPRILLSTRNSNPTNFPRLLAPYMQEWYEMLSRSHRVRLLANSRSGAASYASWIGIPEEHVHVVLNGFQEADFDRVTEADRNAVRAELGVAPDAPVVCGVFRLDAEKQPHLFLEVARRAIEQLPALRVLIAGAGPLQGEMEALLRRHGLEGRVLFLGRRADIGRILAASDVMLLTSTFEGSPNAVIEASHFGVPVVATAGGGTVDAIVHGETGFLAGNDDAEALTDSVLRLLRDQDLRARMREAGPPFIASAFALEEMVDLTLKAFDLLFLDSPQTPTRVISPSLRNRPELEPRSDPRG